MINPVTQFLEAARFLTRLPLPSTGQKSFDLSASLVMFPIVGVFIGAFSGALLWAGTMLGLPSFLSAVIALGGTIILTGGLHEDGLGDMADGFGGGRSKKDKLAIMRDSRIGTYGVLSLVISMAARLGAFAIVIDRVSPSATLYILITAAVLSRAAMVAVVTHLPPARTEGIAATLSPSLTRSITTYVVALAITVAALSPLMAASAIALIIATVCATMLITAAVALRQIGGQTGDVAGAAQQITEITCLFAAVALL